MLDEWSPTSKLSDIKLSHTVDIFSLLVREPTCLPYLFSISSNLFPCFPCFHFEYWITRQLCWSRCKSVAVYVSLRFSNILVDWYFSWPYFNFHWLNFCEFFSGVFFALAEEKKTRQKSRQKMFPQTLYSLSREQPWYFLQKNRMVRTNSSLWVLLLRDNFSDLVSDFLFF